MPSVLSSVLWIAVLIYTNKYNDTRSAKIAIAPIIKPAVRKLRQQQLFTVGNGIFVFNFYFFFYNWYTNKHKITISSFTKKKIKHQISND